MGQIGMFAMGSSVKFSTRFFILRHLPGMGCQTGSKTSKHGIAPLAKQATIAQESSNNFKLLGSYSFGTHQKSLLSSSCGWSVVPRPPYSLTCLVIIDLLFKTGKAASSASKYGSYRVLDRPHSNSEKYMVDRGY